MRIRLRDTDINRLFGTFDAEDEALALARTLLKSYGTAYADDLAMGCERPDGSFWAPLTGAALIERAWRGARDHEPVPESILTGAEVADVRRAR